MSLQLFFGENFFLRSAAVRQISDEFLAAEGDLNLQTLDGATATDEEIITAARTPPFLGTRRLVVIRDLSFKKKRDALVKFLSEAPEHAEIVISASSADARTSLFKAIKKYGEVQEFPPLKPAQFKTWLQNEIKKRGVNFEPAALETLATFTLGDCSSAVNEIEKLKIYAGDRTISQADVEILVHADLHTDVFKLTDAIATRRIPFAIRALHDVVDRGEPIVGTFFMIVRQFRILLGMQTLAARGMSAPAIAKELKLHPFVAQKSLPQIRNFSPAELKSALKKLLAVDEGIKTGRIKVDELPLAVEKFIVEFG